MKRITTWVSQAGMRGVGSCVLSCCVFVSVCVSARAAGVADEAMPLPSIEVSGLKVGASALYDDNVNHSDSDILSDESLSVSLDDSVILPLTAWMRLVLSGGVQFEHFDHWVGLSHADLAAGAQFQYRPAASFYAPILQFGVSARALGYQDSLRSGGASIANLTALEALTDQITASLGAEHEERRAENSTFDGHGDSVRIHLDDSLSSTLTLYGGLAKRYGDAVTSSFRDPDNRAIALALAPDPAFGSTDRIAYRFKASSIIGTVGMNYALAAHQSLDLSWQKVTLFPVRLPSASATQAKYVDNQVVLSYLVQF